MIATCMFTFAYNPERGICYSMVHKNLMVKSVFIVFVNAFIFFLSACPGCIIGEASNSHFYSEFC